MEAFHAFLKFLFWAIGTRARAEYFSCGAANSIIQGGSNFFCFCVKSLRCDRMWIKSLTVTIQMKATEQYFPVGLFIMLYKVVLTFESVDEILKFDHSNESY